MSCRGSQLCSPVALRPGFSTGLPFSKGVLENPSLQTTLSLGQVFKNLKKTSKLFNLWAFFRSLYFS
jgi:hypothetical protein